MNKINSIIIAFAFVLTVTFIGSGISSNGDLSVTAQSTTMGRAGDKIQNTGKKVYRSSRRVGTTIGNRTWTGTKWVASNTWKGGKWIAVKTANGTKWVYRKGKRTVVGKPVRRP